MSDDGDDDDSSKKPQAVDLSDDADGSIQCGDATAVVSGPPSKKVWFDIGGSFFQILIVVLLSKLRPP